MQKLSLFLIIIGLFSGGIFLESSLAVLNISFDRIIGSSGSGDGQLDAPNQIFVDSRQTHGCSLTTAKAVRADFADRSLEVWISRLSVGPQLRSFAISVDRTRR